MTKRSDILISIQPRHSQNIFSGKKIFELRKRIWNADALCGRNVYVYESAPTKKIVGYWTGGAYAYGPIAAMIEHDVHKLACVSADELRKYFEKVGGGYTLFCNDNHKFETPIDPWKVPGFRPPQSWMYMTDEMKARFGL